MKNTGGRRRGRFELHVATMQVLEQRAYRAGITFGGESVVNVGPTPQGITINDFDKNGKADFATTSMQDSAVVVEFGNNDGTFTHHQSIQNVGSDLAGIASGDLNNDGKPDLVVCGDDLSVILGNGNGTFKAVTHVPVGNTPQNATIADVNGDGKMDVVVANVLGTAVSVLLGKGDGTFQSPINATAGGQADVAVGDLNGDGKLDLAVALFGKVPGSGGSAGGSGVGVLLGNGNGTFQAIKPFAAGTRPAAIALGDFNGDGLPDIVTANGGLADLGGSNDVSVLLNLGSGNFAAATNIPAGTLPASLAVADYNSDGFADIIAPSSTEATMDVLPGKGDGTFGTPIVITTIGNASGVVTGDVNGDGIPDILRTAGNEGVTGVFLNTVPTVTSSGGIVTVLGNSLRDTVTVTTSGSNLVVTRDGKATNFALSSVTSLSINTFGGNDVIDCSAVSIPAAIYAGDGDDHVSGGTGNDFIDAGAGNDNVFANDGNDKVIAGAGDDTISGGANKDTLFGGLGNDRLNGNGGNDRLFGEEGADRLYGYEGDDYLDGGSSNDRLEGGAGLDTMLGEGGNDHFFAKDGQIDQVYGGKDTDNASTDINDVIGAVEVITH